ncbi:hypothetical protein [Ferruginibacter sp. SUN106]|uniref:hypothetical protein n=1 Tax=Ferruginibacter sp. SUN106 TaxID=2978348 RepID=UPI003D365123
MKKIFLLFLPLVCFISIRQAAAQDPYSRLKQTAGQNPVLRENLREVVIPESDPRRKVEKKAPVAFRSFEMVDKKGTKIDPEETIAVNDKNEKAKVVFEKLNEIEKEQNAKGYSIRNKESALIIDIITPASELDGRVPEMSKSISPLKSESELKTLSATSKQVSNLTLNPFGQYNSAERERLEGTKFEVNGSGVLSASASGNANGLKTAKRFAVTGVTNPNRNTTLTTGNNTSSATALKVINETSTKDWSFGIMSTFKAGVEVSLVRYAKICPFNPESPGKSLSEFKVSANAKVYGGLFGNSLDLLSGGVEFYAPSDSTKQMSAKAQILVAGITILSMNETATQSKTYSKSNARSVDKSFPINVPICCGIGFSGKIGIKGEVGINYNGGVYRTVATLEAGPVIDLKGYIEAGVSIGGVAKLGVGGELTFIKGNVPLSSYVGIWSQTSSQVVVGYNYYMGYDLNVLSGRLYGYADVCVPVVDACHRIGQVNFFTWGGFKSSGTFVDGGSNYVLANL